MKLVEKVPSLTLLISNPRMKSNQAIFSDLLVEFQLRFSYKVKRDIIMKS